MNAMVSFRVLVASIAFVVLGCSSGPKTCTVSGKVTFQNKPVYGGVVNLMGPNDAFASGGIDFEGNYVVNDAPVGLVKISVVSDKPVTNMRAAKPGVGAPPPPGPTADPAKWIAIDAKYNDPNTSGKEMTLTSGTNSQDIKLD